ncbi:phospholipase A [Granulosicoccaceae sp. 1_MG-2023]|nr:phospholipase A [Granulosicoccaceae sp. 1_MG-2023]
MAAQSSLPEIAQRLKQESLAGSNPYLFTAHKSNFIIPFSYSTGFNEAQLGELVSGQSDALKSYEVEFQLSLKLKLNGGDLLLPDDALYVAFTVASWWQFYSRELSSPFRESNYTPEVFYLAQLKEALPGGDLALMAGLEHQSNGQSQAYSRSWNRLYTGVLYSRERLVAGGRLWYRLPEEEKTSPLDAKGDDNPDILDYYGYGEMLLGWRGDSQEFTLRAHGNPSTGKGGGELAMSFPAFGRFRVVVKYFNGYGNSLIDYNQFQQRVGIGLLLSNLL